MRVLHFPAPRRAVPSVQARIASVATLLSECLGRQSALGEDGRRLQASLDRLSALTHDMVRSTESLRRSLGRLRACPRKLGPPSAPA